MNEIKQLESKINSQDIWDMQLLKELCKLAGLEKEWQESTGDNFEKVVYKAAEILKINI